RPEQGQGVEGGAIRLMERPEMVEDEHTVKACGLGPAGNGQGRLRVLSELRKGDAQPHTVRLGGTSASARGAGRQLAAGLCARGWAPDGGGCDPPRGRRRTTRPSRGRGPRR